MSLRWCGICASGAEDGFAERVRQTSQQMRGDGQLYYYLHRQDRNSHTEQDAGPHFKIFVAPTLT